MPQVLKANKRSRVKRGKRRDEWREILANQNSSLHKISHLNEVLKQMKEAALSEGKMSPGKARLVQARNFIQSKFAHWFAGYLT